MPETAKQHRERIDRIRTLERLKGVSYWIERYERTKDEDDLREALTLLREAVEILDK